MAPAMLFQLVPSSLLDCHWTLGAGVPDAVALNRTVPPASMPTLPG